MKYLLPILEVLRESALRLGGTDEEFITETQGIRNFSERFEHRHPVVKLEEVVANG